MSYMRSRTRRSGQTFYVPDSDISAKPDEKASSTDLLVGELLWKVSNALDRIKTTTLTFQRLRLVQVV